MINTNELLSDDGIDVTKSLDHTERKSNDFEEVESAESELQLPTDMPSEAHIVSEDCPDQELKIDYPYESFITSDDCRQIRSTEPRDDLILNFELAVPTVSIATRLAPLKLNLEEFDYLRVPDFKPQSKQLKQHNLSHTPSELSLPSDEQVKNKDNSLSSSILEVQPESKSSKIEEKIDNETSKINLANENTKSYILFPMDKNQFEKQPSNETDWLKASVDSNVNAVIERSTPLTICASQSPIAPHIFSAFSGIFKTKALLAPNVRLTFGDQRRFPTINAIQEAAQQNEEELKIVLKILNWCLFCLVSKVIKLISASYSIAKRENSKIYLISRQNTSPTRNCPAINLSSSYSNQSTEGILHIVRNEKKIGGLSEIIENENYADLAEFRGNFFEEDLFGNVGENGLQYNTLNSMDDIKIIRKLLNGFSVYYHGEQQKKRQSFYNTYIPQLNSVHYQKLVRVPSLCKLAGERCTMNIRKANSIPHPKDIRLDGEQIYFNAIVLFQLNKSQHWEKLGEGVLEIWRERPAGNYYMFMSDKSTHKLLLLMKVNTQLKINYLTSNPTNCLWAHYNYAKSLTGALECMACHFQTIAIATEFARLIGDCGTENCHSF